MVEDMVSTNQDRQIEMLQQQVQQLQQQIHQQQPTQQQQHQATSARQQPPQQQQGPVIDLTGHHSAGAPEPKAQPNKGLVAPKAPFQAPIGAMAFPPQPPTGNQTGSCSVGHMQQQQDQTPQWMYNLASNIHQQLIDQMTQGQQPQGPQQGQQGADNMQQHWWPQQGQQQTYGGQQDWSQQGQQQDQQVANDMQ